MSNPCNFIHEKDESNEESSPFNWWRSAPELKSDNGLLKTSSSSLTSRFKVLREMERLYLIGERGVFDLKHKLMIYKSGDFWLPIGGIKKENMNIPETNTILLVGLCGSGKSSLVNLMYSVLGRSGVIPFCQTSNESLNHPTMILEEHNVLRSVQSGFCVYDSRGLDCDRMEEGLEEVSQWMTDGVRHNQLCRRSEDDVAVIPTPPSDVFVKRRVNYVMVVANLAEVYKAFCSGGDIKTVLAIRSLFHCPSIRTATGSPILILTHGDLLQPEERLNGRIQICNYLGISVATGVYDIVCLTEQGILPEECDPVTSFALTEAIYRALLQADRTHSPKRTYLDVIMDILSQIMCFIASVFDMLSQLFSEWGNKTKKLY